MATSRFLVFWTSIAVLARGLLGASSPRSFLSRAEDKFGAFGNQTRDFLNSQRDCQCKNWCTSNKCDKDACCACAVCGSAPCTAPTGVQFGSASGTCAEGEELNFGQKCTAQCKEGYNPNVNKLECSDGGVFSPETFTCTGKTCSTGRVPKQHANGSCVEGTPVPSESDCTAWCRDGYVPSVPTLHCAGGVFTPPSFTCEPQGCTVPAGVEHVSPWGACEEGTSFADSATCTPQCADGFWPSEVSLQCSAGAFSPASFTCEPKYEEVGVGTCALVSGWNRSWTITSAYECQQKCDTATKCFFFSHNGSTCLLHERCMELDTAGDSTGYMTYRSPHVTCNAPNTANDEDPSCEEGPIISYGSTCTPRCAPGYRPSVETLTCGGGLFVPEKFTCIPMECAAPTIQYANTSASCSEGALVESGTKCTAICAAGYWPDQAELSCSKGDLNPPDFVCVKSYKYVGTGRCVGSSWSGTRTASTEYTCQMQCQQAANCNFYSFLATADPPCTLFQSCVELDGSAYKTYSHEGAVDCIVPAFPIDDAGADPHLDCDGTRVDSGGSIAPGVKCESVCGDGFQSPSTMITCEEGGELSPPSFTCSGLTCQQPRYIMNDHPEGPCVEQIGNIAHGKTCITACQEGYTPSVDVLHCNTGELSPATFACDESKCNAPVVTNSGSSGSCLEGSTINPKHSCTPTCARGFWKSQKELECRYGELSPATFTCEPEPVWEVEEEICKDGCTSASCRNHCESVWIPLELRIAISDCETACKKTYYLEVEANSRSNCVSHCRQPLQVTYETDPTGPTFQYYDWRTNYFDCYDSDVFEGSEPAERTGEPGCRWLTSPDKGTCTSLCLSALPTEVQVSKTNCDTRCNTEEVPGTADEKGFYRNQCREHCWVDVAQEMKQEEEANNMLGNLGTGGTASDEAVHALALQIVELSDKLDLTRDHLLTDMQQSLTALMQAQLSMDENLRQMGGSGVTKVRLHDGGSDAYNSGSFASPNMLASHNHANFDNTVGLGEFAAVMNGFSFRTRHNDYKLVMPATNNSGWHKTETIITPEVPPSVASKATVQEQIDEMRMYFKAFKTQDVSVRDYRPYFKPLICYLEGSWEKIDGDDIVEPFDSDRHQIAAAGWADLVEKVAMFDFTGGKDTLENLPWLPTRILRIEIEDLRLSPWIGKWNYRLLCHPIDGDVETVRLHVIRDKHIQYQGSSYNMTLDELALSKTARFRVDPRLSLKEVQEDPDRIVSAGRNYLDLLMEQVPGKDNYNAELHDDLLYSTTSRLEPFEEGDPVRAELGTAINSQHKYGPLNTAYYSRYFGGALDAMGRHSYRRGFNDPDFWGAMTTQLQIAEVSMINGDHDVEIGEVCVMADGSPCPRVSQRWTYALPFEIIYMTPLFKWNPYNIETRPGDEFIAGSGTKEHPYTAANQKGAFFRTPSSFFGTCEDSAAVVEVDTADTDAEAVYVKDPNGNKQLVVASGQQIVTRCIPDVGQVRLRYVIAPLYEEGSATWKEVRALERALGEMPAPPERPPLHLRTAPGDDGHTHDIWLSEAQQVSLNYYGFVWVVTSVNLNHLHNIMLSAAIEPHTDASRWQYTIDQCRTGTEIQPAACADGHDGVVVP